MDVLLVSKSGVTPKWLQWAMLGFGIVLLGESMRTFLVTMSGKAFPLFIVGALMAVFSGAAKRLFLAPEGVVREMRVWSRRYVTLIPWSEVDMVTLAFHGQQMMAFFDRKERVTGIRMLFRREEEILVRDIVKKYCPGVHIDLREKTF